MHRNTRSAQSLLFAQWFHGRLNLSSPYLASATTAAVIIVQLNDIRVSFLHDGRSETCFPSAWQLEKQRLILADAYIYLFEGLGSDSQIGERPFVFSFLLSILGCCDLLLSNSITSSTVRTGGLRGTRAVGKEKGREALWPT